MKGPLAHYQYDTFIARFTDPSIEAAYLTFVLDADGKVERVTAKPVSPIADFSFDCQDLLFTPVASKWKSETRYRLKLHDPRLSQNWTQQP